MSVFLQGLRNKSLVLELFTILDDADFDDDGDGRGELSVEDLQQAIGKLDDVVHEKPGVRSIITRLKEVQAHGSVDLKAFAEVMQWEPVFVDIDSNDGTCKTVLRHDKDVETRQKLQLAINVTSQLRYDRIIRNRFDAEKVYKEAKGDLQRAIDTGLATAEPEAKVEAAKNRIDILKARQRSDVGENTAWSALQGIALNAEFMAAVENQGDQYVEAEGSHTDSNQRDVDSTRFASGEKASGGSAKVSGNGGMMGEILGMGKIVVSNLQILSSFIENIELPWPTPLIEFITFFVGLIDLDVISTLTPCVTVDFYFRTMATLALPIVLSGLTLCFGVCRMYGGSDRAGLWTPNRNPNPNPNPISGRLVDTVRCQDSGP